MENLTCVENNAYKQNRSTVAKFQEKWTLLLIAQYKIKVFLKLALEKLGLN